MKKGEKREEKRIERKRVSGEKGKKMICLVTKGRERKRGH